MTKEELFDWRKSLNMSREQFAHAVGVTRKTVYNWENGESRIPPMLDKVVLTGLEK